MHKVMLALPFLLSSLAIAQDPIAVESIAIEHSGNSATVHYAFSADAWKAIGNAVSLELRTRDGAGNTQVEFTADLTAKAGQSPFALPKNAANELEVFFTKDGKVVPMSLGGTVARRLTLEPQTDIKSTAAPSAEWAKVATVVEQCNKVFSGTNRSTCLDIAAKATQDPTPRIIQCGKDMESDKNELACVQHIVPLSFDALPALAACTAVMEGDTKELECVSYAAMATSDPTEIIKSCDKSASGDTAELACIKDALSR